MSARADQLAATAARVEAWAGEPLLQPDENPAEASSRAPAGGARSTRRSSRWTRGGGALAVVEGQLRAHARSRAGPREERPHLASGTELRRHQIDALAGMLTELISRHEEHPDGVNGGPEADEDEDDDAEEDGEELDDEEVEIADDPGAERRFRFRHPTASGKTIAAAGFVEAARTMGVLDPDASAASRQPVHARPDRRGVRTAPLRSRARGPRPAPRQPPDHPDLRLVRPPRRLAAEPPTSSSSVTRPTPPWREDEHRHPQPHRADLHRHDGDRGADREAGLRRFPASVDDLPLSDAARRGLIAPLRCLRVPPAAAISSVPIVGGDYDEDALAKILDHELINQAAASLYRDRFDETPASSMPRGSTTRTTSPGSSGRPA